ncbi:sigma-70 family RNA polymerase sigma factor [Nocardioides salsibiostraticola]
MDTGEALGIRLAARDETALADIYATYGPSVLAFLRRHVGSNEAEDVLQRTFLDVWRHADRYDPEKRFSAWLYTIAHRRAIDTLRSRRYKVVDLEAVRDLVGEDGRDTAERFADAADVRATLLRLSEVDQEVLRLAYYEGLTQVQIAKRLDLPLGTVKSRVLRAMRRMATLMREADAVETGSPTTGPLTMGMRESSLAG